MCDVVLSCAFSSFALGHVQLSRVLARVDEWQFDSFALERASGGRPLSLLAFLLVRRVDLVGRFGLDEPKLVRCVAGMCA